jgi:hypothetical protein
VKRVDDEVISYQIPETVDDFDECQRDLRAVLDLMEKWGIDKIETDGCSTSFSYKYKAKLMSK